MNVLQVHYNNYEQSLQIYNPKLKWARKTFFFIDNNINNVRAGVSISGDIVITPVPLYFINNLRNLKHLDFVSLTQIVQQSPQLAL